MKYVLLDANVVAAFYLPHVHRFQNARDRIKIIFDAARSNGEEIFLYLPNFCVAEVFGVFMKHSFSSWNRYVTRTIDTRIYDSLVKQFQSDIHNGSLIYHYELNRYHVLGINLVAPVDHYFQHRRRIPGRGTNLVPMGTLDQLIISMGVQLVRLHGEKNVAIVSADDRLTEIASKCKSNIPPATIKKLKLDRCEAIVGVPFAPQSFPVPLNLKSCTIRQLSDFFGRWPLNVGELPNYYRHVRP